MALWRLINRSSNLKHIPNQYTRHFFQLPSVSSLSHVGKLTRIRSSENASSDICKKFTCFFDNVRFFAASAQEEVETDGLRLNEKITAPFVRLVMDDGVHFIISRHEALQRAKQLDVDLVEVQRDGDPPVCKLMDYKKEMYKQEVAEKERAKSRGKESLRSGAFKEIRFTPKIAQRDLKLKAETAIKLMDKGYRVKCMAVNDKNKDAGVEKLGELLSRFAPLVKDTVIIESGPCFERKQVFVVLRHVKFGPPKKGGAKKLEDFDINQMAASSAAAQAAAEAASGSQSHELPEEDNTDYESEAEDEITTPHSSSTVAPSKPIFNFSGIDSRPSLNQDRPIASENRYLKKEPRNQFPSGPGGRDTGRFERPGFSNQSPSHQPSNSRYPNQTPNQQHSRPGGSNNPRAGAGVFSNTKRNDE